MDFRWNEWNTEHLCDHGVDPEEAENAVRNARRPFPRKIDDDKWLVWGRGRGGRHLQVIFVLDDDDTIFVVHARPLTDKEKRLSRKANR